MAASNTSKLTLLDMHTDILVTVCSYLTTEDLCSLVQTCSDLRDKLYQPVFWRHAVLRCLVTSEKTTHSLLQRGIKAIKFAGQAVPELLVESLKYCSLVDTLRFMVVDFDALWSMQRVQLPVMRLTNITCLVVHLYEIDVDQEFLLVTFSGILTTMCNIRELYIYVHFIQNFDTSNYDEIFYHIYYIVDRRLPNLQNLEIRPVEWSESGDSSCPAGLSDVIQDQGFQTHRSTIERFCGPQTGMLELKSNFPLLKHLGLNSCPIYSFNTPQCQISSVQSLSLSYDFHCPLDNADPSSLLCTFPNLIALEVGCYIDLIDEAVDNTVKTCPNLRALVIRPVGNALTVYSVANIIHSLRSLEVLVLPTHVRSAALSRKPEHMPLLVDMTQLNLDSSTLCSSKLKSLLGVRMMRQHLEMFPTLKYTSHPEGYGAVLRIRDDCAKLTEAIRLVPLEVDDPYMYAKLFSLLHDANEACGRNYFYPENSIKYFAVLEEEMSLKASHMALLETGKVRLH